MDALYQSARAEGRVNLIGLPPDWVNYDDIIASFEEQFPGVTPDVHAPDSSAADQLAAVEAQAGTEDMPDVLDIAPTLDVRAIDPVTWAPYQPTVWDDIPEPLRGPDAQWVDGYYGVVAIATNADVLADNPTTFADLTDPRYLGQVTLTGDPVGGRDRVRGRDGRVARQRRIARRRDAGHRVLRRAARRRQPRRCPDRGAAARPGARHRSCSA